MFQQFKRVLAAGAVAFAVIAPLRAQTQAPAIEFHTVRGEMDYSKFSFTLGCIEESYVDIDFGYGPMEYKVGQADFDSASGSIKGTTIEGEVSPEGVVKVYIDNPLQIDYLDIEGVYADELEISGLKNLDILNVSHNYLKALDLTPFKRLAAVYLSDNPFDEKPLLFGPSHPELQILEMENIGALDQSFTLTAFPALKVFFAFHTLDLRVCDTSNNPDLLVLCIDTTNVESIDLSNNPELVELSISQTKIKEFDLTKTPKLGALYCSHDGAINSEPEYKLKSLDVSMLESLKILFASGNMIESLDLTNCPEVWHLSLQGNQLSGIDFSGNPDLYNVDISNNNMDFVTIPKPLPTYGEYYYYQRAMPVDRSYPVGATIDLSARLNRPNSTTTAQLFCNGEQLSNEYYTYEDGKITLLKATTDSVTLNFTNTDFLEYGLYTTSFKVKEVEDFGKDNAMVTWQPRPSASTVSLKVGIAGATPENPKSFSVDFGDGNPVAYTTTTNLLPDMASVQGEKQGFGEMILYLPEGEDLTAFGIYDMPLVNLDVSNARSLVDLTANNCSLLDINLLNNRWLQNLNLDNNQLEILDLTGPSFGNQKTLLHNISANNNRLIDYIPVPIGNAYELSLANNRLEDVDLVENRKLRTLDVSGNLLTDINLIDCEALEYLNVSGNNMSSIFIPEYTPIETLDISGNVFPLTNIVPVKKIKNLTYAPQQPWALPEKAPGINLKMQEVTDGTRHTEFKWYRADTGAELTSEQISGKDAVFKFLDASVGEVFATWTNPLFPDFNGENIYRSQNVLVSEPPTNVIATFTPKKSGEAALRLRSAFPNNYVYIDWTGEGDLVQYEIPLEPSIECNAKVYPNQEVKLYSYEEEHDGISTFSMSDIPLANMDLSKLADLKYLYIQNDGLEWSTLKLPSTELLDLNLSANNMAGMDLTPYTSLRVLYLGNCSLTEFDSTPFENLRILSVSGNKLEKFTVNNPKLWDLSAGGCGFETIDLSHIPAMEQLQIGGNNLTTVDVSKMPYLKVLQLERNKFTLTTLPRVLSTYAVYDYSNQALYPVKVQNGNVIDISDQLMVGSNRTNYRWFRDRNVGYLADGTIAGDELESGVDYTEENGVFTFNVMVKDAVCVMTNQAFPKLIYISEPTDIQGSGVENVEAGRFEVYVAEGSVTVAADSGIVYLFSADGRLVGQKAANGDTVRFNGLDAGIYMVSNGEQTVKVLVK